MSKNIGLSLEDIRHLLKSPLEKRMDVTKKIAEFYSSGGFDDDQMKIIEYLFRSLVKDTEVQMRKTLAESIKNISTIPADVVKSLSEDVQEVSLPVLEFSEVLSDADLIDIIESTQDVKKLVAVSNRDEVSEDISGALVESKSEEVVDSLLKNEKAAVSEKSYMKIANEFADKEDVMNAMVGRHTLPISVIETLTTKISDALYEKLGEKHKDEFSQISDEIKNSRDVVTMKALGLKASDEDYKKFRDLMQKLHVADELIPISALCMGNMNMFEVSVARITQAPVLNIRQLMHDESNKGFEAVYTRAGLPMNLFAATEILIQVLRDLEEELENEDGFAVSKKMANRMIEGYMMRVEEEGEVQNMDYILSLIRHNATIGIED